MNKRIHNIESLTNDWANEPDVLWMLSMLREARLLLECTAESLIIVSDDVDRDTYNKITEFLKELE